MQVFVVDAGDYEQNHIIQICATEELAKQYVATYNSKLTCRNKRGELYDEAEYTAYPVVEE